MRSAVDVCDRLGVMTPWHYRESYKHLNKPERLCPLDKQFNALDPSVSYRQAFYIFLFDKYMKRCIRKGFLRIVLPSGKELCYGDPNTTEVVETHVHAQGIVGHVLTCLDLWGHVRKPMETYGDA